MIHQTFRALVVREQADGRMSRQVETRNVSELPSEDVLIRVHYSSLNYKDALSGAGNKGVTRRYPHTTGVDAAGVVQASEHADFSTGQQVIVTGHDLGMNTPGGHGEYIRVPASWIVPLPAGLSLKESMAYGTAGYTAVLSILRLKRIGISPGDGDVLVTGASGGVGSVAVGILAQIGYSVIAATRKQEAAEPLRQLGAADVVKPDEITPPSKAALAKSRWSGVIDTVGGPTLDGAIRSTRRRGAVTCCGNVTSATLTTSIYPFILRGVSLLGIDAAESPMSQRRMIWDLLAGDWKVPEIERIVSDCSIEDLSSRMDAMLSGESRGRVRVNLIPG